LIHSCVSALSEICCQYSFPSFFTPIFFLIVLVFPGHVRPRCWRGVVIPLDVLWSLCENLSFNYNLNQCCL
jgi:hypothetical protein